jgi:hypothetical protein
LRPREAQHAKTDEDVEGAAERRHGRANDALDRDKCEDVALADVGYL